MASYSRVRMVSMAGDLQIASWMMIVGKGVKYATCFFAYHAAKVFVMESIEALTHHLVSYSDLHKPDVTTQGFMIFWAVVGCFVGWAGSQSLRIESQRLLCEVEQEMHLSKIAEELRVRPWPIQPPPKAPGPSVI